MLRTGDLARISDDGLVRIVGRRADWTKVMGIRIDLGQVERRLRDAGFQACVTGTDQQLQVSGVDGAAAGQLAGRLRAVARLPVAAMDQPHLVEGLDRISRGLGGVTQAVRPDGHGPPPRQRPGHATFSGVAKHYHGAGRDLPASARRAAEYGVHTGQVCYPAGPQRLGRLAAVVEARPTDPVQLRPAACLLVTGVTCVSRFESRP